MKNNLTRLMVLALIIPFTAQAGQDDEGRPQGRRTREEARRLSERVHTHVHGDKSASLLGPRVRRHDPLDELMESIPIPQWRLDAVARIKALAELEAAAGPGVAEAGPAVQNPNNLGNCDLCGCDIFEHAVKCMPHPFILYCYTHGLYPCNWPLPLID